MLRRWSSGSVPGRPRRAHPCRRTASSPTVTRIARNPGRQRVAGQGRNPRPQAGAGTRTPLRRGRLSDTQGAADSAEGPRPTEVARPSDPVLSAVRRDRRPGPVGHFLGRLAASPSFHTEPAQPDRHSRLRRRPELNVKDNPPRAGDRDRHGQEQAIARRLDSGIRESRNQAGLHLLCGTGTVAGALLDLHPQPRRCARSGSVQIPRSGSRISTRKVHRAAPLPGGRGQPGEVLLNVDRYLRLAIRHAASITRRYVREPLSAAHPQAAHQPFTCAYVPRQPDTKPRPAAIHRSGRYDAGELFIENNFGGTALSVPRWGKARPQPSAGSGAAR